METGDGRKETGKNRRAVGSGQEQLTVDKSTLVFQGIADKIP